MRGKELPPILKIALEQQAGLETEELQEMPNEPIVIENHPNDSRVKIDNRPCIVKEQAYCLQGNMIGREEKNGPQGSGVNENVSFSLTATDKHAVVYALDRASFNQGQNAQFDISIQDDGTAQTLVAKGPGAVAQPTAPPIRYIVRRLTPIECERLQGYPDDWTQLPKIKDMTDEEYGFYLGVFMLDKEITGKSGTKPPTKKALVKWYNKLDSDTSRYKGTGNSIAVPCAHDVIRNITEAEAERSMNREKVEN